MKFTKSKRNNIIFVIVIALMLIPQTRKPIQIILHKGLALILKPSVIDKEKRALVSNFNWKLKNQSGNVINFQNTKDKVVVLNFWATWCPPCIAEMPSLQKLYNDYNGDVEFLFISNEESTVITDFMTENNYTFNVYKPLSNYPVAFNVSSIPRTFVINKKGEIVIDKTGAADWNSSSIRTLLDSLLASE